MSLSSWQASMQRLLNRPAAEARIAIVGIGNYLRCDDTAGSLAARALMDTRLGQDRDTILVMDAGHAPENGTSQLRRFEPDVILLIDAAEMGEQPGTIRMIDIDEIEGMSASTHTLPLSILANYLVLELNCQLALIGIQSASTEVGEEVHPKVLRAVREIVEHILTILPASQPA
jgi:hydrogenase 3 maturation protease